MSHISVDYKFAIVGIMKQNLFKLLSFSYIFSIKLTKSYNFFTFSLRMKCCASATKLFDKYSCCISLEFCCYFFWNIIAQEKLIQFISALSVVPKNTEMTFGLNRMTCVSSFDRSSDSCLKYWRQNSKRGTIDVDYRHCEK